METISEERRKQILSLLDEIEEQHDVAIIHAVESGSRAWGFPSTNSDYDIRFIYHHTQEWYITAFTKKDHIDIAISNDLDAGGWDIGKCMRLLYNGNAVLQEWLNSPVIYRTDSRKHSQLKALATEVFNPTAAFYHYLSLAKKKFTDEATRKNAKYFLYGMRSLLCAQWIADKRSIPPVLFNDLVEEYLSPREKSQTNQILEEKAKGSESDHFEIPDPIWEWSIHILNALTSIKVEGTKQLHSERFDAVLREITKKN